MQVILERVERKKNCYRFFNISLEPNLFRDVSLVVKWGRIGSLGRLAIRASGSEEEMSARAAALLRAKIRRGYRPVAVGVRGNWAFSSRRAMKQADLVLARAIATRPAELLPPAQ